jgi:hypothetical protein
MPRLRGPQETTYQNPLSKGQPARRLDTPASVPATEVAAWAGHSVEMLTRVYARCVVGLEGVWSGRMDQALHLEEP